jgi:hypothetical protein
MAQQAAHPVLQEKLEFQRQEQAAAFARQAVDEQRAQEQHEAKVMTEAQKARSATMGKVDVQSDLAPLVALMAELVQEMKIAISAPRVAVRDEAGNLIGSWVQPMQVALADPRARTRPTVDERVGGQLIERREHDPSVRHAPDEESASVATPPAGEGAAAACQCPPEAPRASIQRVYAWAGLRDSRRQNARQRLS